MGDAADMIIDGTVDEITGELIDGESPGYPRRKRTYMNPVFQECPKCGKRCRGEQGVRDHIAAKHAGGDCRDIPC